jgi:hypothetical protein
MQKPRPKNLPATKKILGGEQIRRAKGYVTTFVAFTPYLTPRGDPIPRQFPI